MFETSIELLIRLNMVIIHRKPSNFYNYIRNIYTRFYRYICNYGQKSRYKVFDAVLFCGKIMKAVVSRRPSLGPESVSAGQRQNS